MKILAQINNFEEIELKTPFYAYSHEEDCEFFIKIDESGFKQITNYFHGEVRIFFTKNIQTIAQVWLQNECDSSTWDNAVEIADEMFAKIKGVNEGVN